MRQQLVITSCRLVSHPTMPSHRRPIAIAIATADSPNEIILHKKASSSRESQFPTTGKGAAVQASTRLHASAAPHSVSALVISALCTHTPCKHRSNSTCSPMPARTRPLRPALHHRSSDEFHLPLGDERFLRQGHIPLASQLLNCSPDHRSSSKLRLPVVI